MIDIIVKFISEAPSFPSLESNYLTLVRAREAKDFPRQELVALSLMLNVINVMCRVSFILMVLQAV